MKKTIAKILRLVSLGILPVSLWLQTVTSGAQPVIRVAAGNFHSLFLKGDGSLWGMGMNNVGQLGDGTTNKGNLPEKIVAGNVVAIAAGGGYSLFVKDDGSLWAMGYNGTGQLGDGTTNLSLLPEKIVSSNVVAIAAGFSHSLFVKKDGSLWAMGDNTYGQLGDGAVYTSNSPVTFVNHPEMIVASNVTAVAAGRDHSLFLKSDGSLWGMGLNDFGQLDDITNLETYRPAQIFSTGITAIAAGFNHSFFIDTNGVLMGMGDNHDNVLGCGGVGQTFYPLVTIGIDTNVTAISSAYSHSLYTMNDGTLMVVGADQFGQLGDGTNIASIGLFPEEIVASGVTAVATGVYHSLFLKNDGSLWAMGDNYYGQLGDGTYNSTNLPELIVAGPPGYNQISVQLLSAGSVGLTYVGMAGTNYELDRSFSLSPPNWVPQVTNPAGVGGALVFTNTLNPASNNFWRIRSAP